MAAAELEAQGFRPLDETSLVAYIRATPALAASLGGRVDDLEVKEVGDGNLNFVYIVLSDAGSVVVKQALPYIRSAHSRGPDLRRPRRPIWADLGSVGHGLRPELGVGVALVSGGVEAAATSLSTPSGGDRCRH